MQRLYIDAVNRRLHNCEKNSIIAHSIFSQQWEAHSAIANLSATGMIMTCPWRIREQTCTGSWKELIRVRNLRYPGYQTLVSRVLEVDLVNPALEHLYGKALAVTRRDGFLFVP